MDNWQFKRMRLLLTVNYPLSIHLNQFFFIKSSLFRHKAYRSPAIRSSCRHLGCCLKLARATQTNIWAVRAGLLIFMSNSINWFCVLPETPLRTRFTPCPISFRSSHSRPESHAFRRAQNSRPP